MLTFDLKRLGHPRYIINFPTKKHWRGKSHIDYIKAGLPSLVRTVKDLSIESIAASPLEAPVSRGLDWLREVYRISRRPSRLSNVEVLVYEPSGAPI